MDLTNVQPTTPIGGYAAGGAPSEPDELGSRESARAVLSAMLETPADPGSASARGGGINLQSLSAAISWFVPTLKRNVLERTAPAYPTTSSSRSSC